MLGEKIGEIRQDYHAARSAESGWRPEDGNNLSGNRNQSWAQTLATQIHTGPFSVRMERNMAKAKASL